MAEYRIEVTTDDGGYKVFVADYGGYEKDDDYAAGLIADAYHQAIEFLRAEQAAYIRPFDGDERPDPLDV